MWKGNLITEEGQLRTLDEVLGVYRSQGVRVEHELRTVSVHDLLATQSSLDPEKLEVVIERVRTGSLDVPFIVEEHFVDDHYRRYVVDAHTRVRARIELGERTARAYVIWSPAGRFSSGLAAAAATYGM